MRSLPQEKSVKQETHLLFEKLDISLFSPSIKNECEHLL